MTEFIARLRHAVPGIPLISPPPHHDIYSIEDLAQLIHDLKQVNPAARVGVKLVAEAGVGTVAAGVAKAFADYVLISGHNGGTGASPLSSIKHAGMPWELGLAETQAILLRNGLRERIEVRVDGGLRTGRDVVLGAVLGAEAFGFGTAAVVAIGCAMARQCHLNTCPTGIATQRPDLRRKFRGTPEQVVAYFTLLAEDVRRILASLGVRSLDEIIGRVELLDRVHPPDAPRAALLDLGALLDPPPAHALVRRRTVERNVRPGVESLDQAIQKDLDQALARSASFVGSYRIGNHHLTVGARIAGDIARRFGAAGLPAPVHLRFRGSAGQSFGAFTVPRMHLDLEGEANDHVGKGLCGGEIVIRPFPAAAYADGRGEHVILGNTALYGATAGRLFAAGAAGDRFAVRQFRRRGGGRGRGRPLLRVHDRRDRGRAGSGGSQLRRRHVERRGVRPRPRPRAGDPLQSGHGGGRGPELSRGAGARDVGAAPLAQDGESARPGDSRSLGDYRALFRKVAPRDATAVAPPVVLAAEPASV